MNFALLAGCAALVAGGSLHAPTLAQARDMTATPVQAKPAGTATTAAAVPLPRPSPWRIKSRPPEPVATANALPPAQPDAAAGSVRVAYAADPGDSVENPFSWLMRQTIVPYPASETLPTGEPRPVPPASIPLPDRTAVPQIEPRYHVRRVPISAAELVVMIENKAIKHGVPLALAHAVVRVESNFDPRVTGRGTTLGLMQIKFPTAKAMGYTGSAEELLGPETNLEWGMRYLARAHRLARGDICGTVMRYQGGLQATKMSAAAIPYCGKVKTLMAAR